MSNELLISLYREMLNIRLCEEQLARCHQGGLVHGACHTYVGQEAIAVGVCAHLRTEDVVFSTHRGHGHALAKGVPPRQVFAELFGRATGCSQGRGGSMHLFSPEVGMMGTSGIVGPCILQAAGAGYSFKLMKTDQVAVAFFGDGASNNGAFHEGLNMASIWKLPVLFVCENNQFATEVPFSYSCANPDVASRGASYGMPGVLVNGNDVLAVREAAGEAVRRAKAGNGPTLLECRTYRTRPHAEGMGDFTYRTKEDVEAWKTRCPIKAFRQYLLTEKIVSEGLLTDIEAEIKAVAADAQRFAEASAWPDPATAATHVFAEPTPVKPSSAPATSDDPARQITFMQATLEALRDEMEINPRIFVMGEGIGVRGGNFKTTAGLFEKHGPVRLCDTPICERGFVGMAGGAAMTGTRPVIDFMFADFVLDGLGEIINQIAKMQYMSSGRLKMPVLLRGCIGIGHSAATHHSGSYHTLFAHCPGLRVVVPSNPRDAKGLLKHALRCDDPVVFLEHREILNVKGYVPEDEEIPFGKAAIVREGRDVTVVAVAHMVQHSIKVCEKLSKEGVSVELVDPRTIAPLDVGTILASVHKTGRLLIIDGAFGPFGLGAEIAACVADHGFDDLDAPIRRLHGKHTPTPYSPPLEAAVVPGMSDIEKAIRDLLAE
ncbi:alpha-ketoacid dehydrogenase subunit alpha/beta [Zavarzinella formosa]|uniref:alpha-ketoacid dehydrogenase subunit alpha/beta n=1 Tax=Zavarzinella formosa TaxID=360055 RepID=UPI000307E805|nr:pyruvate dehydrogenase complex E1 component subunit beta [Zavarzinella formosa]